MSLLSGLKTSTAAAVLSAFLLVSAQAAIAGDRLLFTGGVTQAEGSAGSGIVPYALIAGLGTSDQIGGTAFVTNVSLPNYIIDAKGAAIGIKNRIELSYARQTLSIDNVVTTPIANALKLPSGALNNTTINQDIFGAKIRLVGDAVYDQNKALPQISLGVQVKRNLDFAVIPKTLGAKHAVGTDIYLTATKIYLNGIAGHPLILTQGIRATKANEIGLLAFGGDKHDNYSAQFESSAAVLLTHTVALGADYRTYPDNLSASKQENWKDIFVAVAPFKNLAFVFAYADLGNLPGGIGAGGITKLKADGIYLSGQLTLP